MRILILALLLSSSASAETTRLVATANSGEGPASGQVIPLSKWKLGPALSPPYEPGIDEGGWWHPESRPWCITPTESGVYRVRADVQWSMASRVQEQGSRDLYIVAHDPSSETQSFVFSRQVMASETFVTRLKLDEQLELVGGECIFVAVRQDSGVPVGVVGLVFEVSR